MNTRPEHLNEPILKFARTDFPLLKDDWSVARAMEVIREEGIGERIIYFYVVDANARLVGVLPTRRLLTAPLATPLKDVMITRVVTIPHNVSVIEACEMFVLHKFFAFPVVDEEKHVKGVVDVSLFTEEVFDIAEREQMEGVFEAIGFHASQVRDASPLKAFRYRFPWLMATIASGTACALLAGWFETTLAASLILAFFLTLVLALGESVSMQSMTVTIQALRAKPPTVAWYLNALRRELPTAALLGLACGVVVGVIVWLWRNDAMGALTIGLCIILSVTLACVFGLSIPTLLHASRLDPKIAAGPITLATADIATLLIYLSLATWLLGKGGG